jgi:hypothetical protein
MQYSQPVMWAVTAILTCCVVLSIRKHNKPAMWVATGLVLYCILLATDDYSELGFWAAMCGLAYLVLLKLSPDAARVWLCAGGALAGALVVGATTISIIDLFFGGWKAFGVLLWVTPVFAAGGLLIGFWVVYRWTEPRQLNELQQSESRD